MTFLKDYDAYRLQGPEEPDDMTDEEREAAEEYENERGDWLLQRMKDEENEG